MVGGSCGSETEAQVPELCLRMTLAEFLCFIALRPRLLNTDILPHFCLHGFTTQILPTGVLPMHWLDWVPYPHRQHS